VNEWTLEDILICTPRSARKDVSTKPLRSGIYWSMRKPHIIYYSDVPLSTVSTLHLAKVSTLHLAMKFSSTTDDIATIHVDQKTVWECYVACLKVEPSRHLNRSPPRGWSSRRRGRSAEKYSQDEQSRKHRFFLSFFELYRNGRRPSIREGG